MRLLVSCLASSMLLFLAPMAATAQSDFATCLARLEARALQEGHDTEAVNAVLSRAEYLPRVISADRQQAEFTQTFTDYYSKRVTAKRVASGRQLRSNHRDLLDALQREYGVPSQYLVALWGLETNFGGYLGNLTIPSALATLACDNRRSKFFADELITLIGIVGGGDMGVDELIGSWAGAMGHMQFMPSTFAAHAVDGDGDGKRNLYSSLADALGSGAHYLVKSGWQQGFKWGREVILSDSFDYAQAGSHNWRPLSYWRNAGIRDVHGELIPPLTIESAILLPSGHSGPAFLVYENFRVLMRWNRSEFYALSVGRLADRIAGAGKLHTPLPKRRIATQDVMNIQRHLATLGYAVGSADGILGPATRKAIREFQQAHNLIADGYPNPEVVQKIDAITGRS